MSERTMDAIDKGASHPIVRRAMIGALYGLLTGTAFVLMSAFIDILLHPDLPLGVDWSLTAERWAWIGLGLTLIGALTCLFNETWAGLLAGAITAALLALINSLLSSSSAAGIKLMVLMFTLVPIATMSLPISWILRRLGEAHGLASQSDKPATRLAVLMLISVALGAGSGSFTKMSPSGLEVMRYTHGLLQNVADENNPIRNVDGLQDHQGAHYKLYQTRSEFSTEGYNIRVEYEDGFVLQCVAVLYPGRDPYISTCKPEL